MSLGFLGAHKSFFWSKHCQQKVLNKITHMLWNILKWLGNKRKSTLPLRKTSVSSLQILFWKPTHTLLKKLFLQTIKITIYECFKHFLLHLWKRIKSFPELNNNGSTPIFMLLCYAIKNALWFAAKTEY